MSFEVDMEYLLTMIWSMNAIPEAPQSMKADVRIVLL